MIRYSNLGSAVYAKEKLNGFEYPPGNRLSVTFIDDGEDRTRSRPAPCCYYSLIFNIPLLNLLCKINLHMIKYFNIVGFPLSTAQ